MGSFSIWHWLIVLLIFGLPVLAVATEKSGRMMPRKRYVLWVVGLLAYGFVASIIADAISDSDSIAPALIGVGHVLGLSLILFFYNRAVVRRLRDASHGRTLAYFGIIPVLNLLLAVYLLFKPHRASTFGATQERGDGKT